MKIYIVQKGDTLYEIAQKHGVSLAELKKMNTQLSDPDQLMPGMKIKVPTGSKPVTKKEVQLKKKKEVPIKKKEVPIKKEKPIEKAPAKKMPVEEKKKAPAKKMPPPKKAPAKKMEPIQKGKSEPITKGKKEPISFKHSNVKAPSFPVKEDNMHYSKSKGAVNPNPNPNPANEYPMMDESFPNMIAPKKGKGGPMDYTSMPKWEFPHHHNEVIPVPPSYFTGPAEAVSGTEQGQGHGQGHSGYFPQGSQGMQPPMGYSGSMPYGYMPPVPYPPMQGWPQSQQWWGAPMPGAGTQELPQWSDQDMDVPEQSLPQGFSQQGSMPGYMMQGQMGQMPQMPLSQQMQQGQMGGQMPQEQMQQGQQMPGGQLLPQGFMPQGYPQTFYPPQGYPSMYQPQGFREAPPKGIDDPYSMWGSYERYGDQPYQPNFPSDEDNKDKK